MGQNINKALNEMSWKEHSEEWSPGDVSDEELNEIKALLDMDNNPDTKSIPNPLKEIDDYIDTIGEDISKAVGNLNEIELKL